MSQLELLEVSSSEKDAPSYGEESVGAWFDGARGIYMGDAIICEAIAHGWKCDVPGEDAGPYQSSPSWAGHEHYHDLWDEAEDFMAQFAADGYWFGTSEGGGDWGLWECESEEDDSMVSAAAEEGE